MTKNKHENDRAKEIASDNTILLTQVGSGLHGITVDNQDDFDAMGVCIEPPSCVIGLESFEQYQWRTQPEGSRSGPGDVDLTIYSLRKWAALAAQGNPTVLLLLFSPRDELVYLNGFGSVLQRSVDLFLSKDCGRRFLGYLDAQWERLLGVRSRRTNGPELIEEFGFDTKFAYHAIRLGIQGNELLSTGNITLPMPEPDRQWLKDLRVGAYSKEDALERIEDLRADLEQLVNRSDLPDKPDFDKLNEWLIMMYQRWWSLTSRRESAIILLDRTSTTNKELSWQLKLPA